MLEVLIFYPMHDNMDNIPSFLTPLQMIRSHAPLHQRDINCIKSIVSVNAAKSSAESSFEFYDDGSDGLRERGWIELANSSTSNIDGIAFATNDKRKLCSIKLTPLHSIFDIDSASREIVILKSLHHPNVSKLVSSFLTRSKIPGNASVAWLLLEYPDAGHMETEIQRFPNQRIPESGSRYYAKQICAGVAYLHVSGITHNRLHLGNLCLKYKPDMSKRILITDFAHASLFQQKDANLNSFRMDQDVRNVMRAIRSMLLGLVGPMVADLSHYEYDLTPCSIEFVDQIQRVWLPDRTILLTIQELRSEHWFNLQSYPPMSLLEEIVPDYQSQKRESGKLEANSRPLPKRRMRSKIRKILLCNNFVPNVRSIMPNMSAIRGKITSCGH